MKVGDDIRKIGTDTLLEIISEEDDYYHTEASASDKTYCWYESKNI